MMEASLVDYDAKGVNGSNTVHAVCATFQHKGEDQYKVVYDDRELGRSLVNNRTIPLLSVSPICRHNRILTRKATSGSQIHSNDFTSTKPGL